MEHGLTKPSAGRKGFCWRSSTGEQLVLRNGSGVRDPMKRLPLLGRVRQVEAIRPMNEAAVLSAARALYLRGDPQMKPQVDPASEEKMRTGRW